MNLHPSMMWFLTAINTSTKPHLESICAAVQQLWCPCVDCTSCISQLDPVGYWRSSKSQQGWWEENQIRWRARQRKERRQAHVWMEERKKKWHNYTTQNITNWKNAWYTVEIKHTKKKNGNKTRSLNLQYPV